VSETVGIRKDAAAARKELIMTLISPQEVLPQKPSVMHTVLQSEPQESLQLDEDDEKFRAENHVICLTVWVCEHNTRQ